MDRSLILSFLLILDEWMDRSIENAMPSIRLDGHCLVIASPIDHIEADEWSRVEFRSTEERYIGVAIR